MDRELEIKEAADALLIVIQEASVRTAIKLDRAIQLLHRLREVVVERNISLDELAVTERLMNKLGAMTAVKKHKIATLDAMAKQIAAGGTVPPEIKITARRMVAAYAQGEEFLDRLIALLERQIGDGPQDGKRLDG